VSKRKDSYYVSGRSLYWIKSKNPNAPAVKREEEVDWAEWAKRKRRFEPTIEPLNPAGRRAGGNELSRSIVIEDFSLWRSPHAHAPSIPSRTMPSLTGKMAPSAAQRAASE
jgi:hypothetical protein